MYQGGRAVEVQITRVDSQTLSSPLLAQASNSQQGRGVANVASHATKSAHPPCATDPLNAILPKTGKKRAQLRLEGYRTTMPWEPRSAQGADECS